MGEPLTRTGEAEDAADGPLARASARLQHALDSLAEALADAAERPSAASTPVLAPEQDRNEGLVIELDAARRRSRELEAAAADASRALGRAAAEVRRTLDEDAERQGLFDFAGEPVPAADDALEAKPFPAQETAAAPAEEDPAA